MSSYVWVPWLFQQLPSLLLVFWQQSWFILLIGAMNPVNTKERNYSNCDNVILLKSPDIAGRLRNKNWLKRRWLDFRNGHGIYLIFFMTIAQFVIIQYRLLLDKIPLFHSIPIWAFTVLFVAIYVPLGAIIGYWHRRTQYNVENQTHFERNEIGATMQLFLIDLIDGKVTEEEKRQMRRYLLKIMRQPERPLIGTNNLEQDVRSQKN
jgi:hypothetical protein